MGDDEDSEDSGRSKDVGGAQPVRPIADRLRAMGFAFVLIAVWAALGTVVGTVTGLYHGVNGGQDFGDETAATADVGVCRRTGPITGDALGYWWECDVTVRTADGRLVHTTVERSMVTPDDVGRPVRFEELCDDDGDDCRYGVPTAYGWTLLVGCLHIMHRAVVSALGLMALFCLTVAVLGPVRAQRVLDRFNDREPPAERAASRADVEADIAYFLRTTPGQPRPPWARDVTDG